MKVRDKKGQRYQLQRELKRGGEGAIRLVQTRPDLVAKIYHQPGSRPEAKLAWMVEHPPDDPTATTLDHISIAWPRALLYRSGQFIGCLMPFIDDAVPLLMVFNPRLRQRTLPGFDWRYLHRTAGNLTSVVSAVHAKGYVIGDLNEGNFLVRRDALVSLLDCDSFQVIARTGNQRKVFRCPVGKAEYTPPELQGVTYAEVDRTTDHDSFGIGVLLFQLLLNGNHPFRSDWRGRGEAPELAVKIKEGLFPHGKGAPSEVAPPDAGPSLEWLHPAVQDMMIRCFVDGHRPPHRRPSAEEWEQAIKTAEQALVQCREGHVYSGHLPACPHCAVATERVRTVGSRAQRVTQTGDSASPLTSPIAPSPRQIRPPLHSRLTPLIASVLQTIWLALAWLLPRMKRTFSGIDGLFWSGTAFAWIIFILILYLINTDGSNPVRLTGRDLTRTMVARTVRPSATTARATAIATYTIGAMSTNRIEACQLISRQDAEAIIGQALRGDPFPQRSSRSGADLWWTCVYSLGQDATPGDEEVVLYVRTDRILMQDDRGNAATAFVEDKDTVSVFEGSEGYVVVTNLGDDAYFVPTPSDPLMRPYSGLNVLDGDVFLTLQGLPLEKALPFMTEVLENL
jgi:serine/threonine protein kinase